MAEHEPTGMRRLAHELQEKRRLLGQRVSRLDDELRAPLDPGFADQATELEDADAKDAIERTARAEIAQIDDALERIASSAYGVCSRCGDPIAPARLAALPYATTCIACAGP
ncbi:MAG: TraR/DksA family transcriptional regulator [Alphaproteobacteria bacterium]